MLIYQWVNHFNHIGIRQSFFMVVHRGWPLGIYQTMGFYHWLRLMGNWREITIKHGNFDMNQETKGTIARCRFISPLDRQLHHVPRCNVAQAPAASHQAQRPQNGSSIARSCTHQAQRPQRTSIHRCRRSKRMLNHWQDTACAMCHTVLRQSSRPLNPMNESESP